MSFLNTIQTRRAVHLTTLTLSLIVTVSMGGAHAQESSAAWYSDRALADPNRPYLYYPDAQKKAKVEQSLPTTGAQAQSQLEQLQESVKFARALALMNPTQQNVQDYIKKQEIVMEKSAMFADVWKRALMENPTLDYSLSAKGRPTNATAMAGFDRDRQNRTKQIIQYVANNMGLVFFVSSTCTYCHQFAPILKEFQQTYGFRIMTVSLDGRSIPGFDALPDNGIASRLGVTVTPSLFIADTMNKAYIPLGSGVMSTTELESRFLTAYTQPGESF